MSTRRFFDYPTMSGPAVYRVRVCGCLDANLSGKLEGMHIENLTQNDGKIESVLEGLLLDQAALSGILNKLYDMHLPVMSVDCLGGLNGESGE